MTRGVLVAQGARCFAKPNSLAKDVEKVEAIKSAAARADDARGRELAIELFSLVAGLGVGLVDTWRGVNCSRAGIILRGGA